jgi:pimeloyl-ACP methyl ester carboxylesterase
VRVSKLVLVPGFGCPPITLRSLARTLRRHGHEVDVVDLGFNVGCGERAVDEVVRCVLDAGGPVTLVGHSRGGQLARVAAVRASDTVERLVTVATPWSIGPPDRAGVAAVSAAVRTLRRAGWPGFASIDCASGACCDRYRVDVDGTPAARWVALWSRRDRVAGPDATPPDAADAVIETGLSHLGMVTTGRGQRFVLDALAV